MIRGLTGDETVTDKLSVSVILPVKNGARYLAAALASVLAQHWPPDEILVVDGDSADKSLEIARSFPRVRPLLQQGRGLADAWNTGIEAAQGELITFIESDDLWTSYKLRKQISYFARHPAIQYVIGRVKFFLEPGHDVPLGFKSELLESDHIGWIPGTLMARKSLFQTIGSFDTVLTIAADVDWFARCKDHFVPMMIINEVLLHKRIHDSNLSSNAGVNTRELLKLLRTSVARQRNFR